MEKPRPDLGLHLFQRCHDIFAVLVVSGSGREEAESQRTAVPGEAEKG